MSPRGPASCARKADQRNDRLRRAGRSRVDEGGNWRVGVIESLAWRGCTTPDFADAPAVIALADAPVATPPLHPGGRRGGPARGGTDRGRVVRCRGDGRRDHRRPTKRHLHAADVGAGGDPHRNGLWSSAGGGAPGSGAPPGAGLGRNYRPCRPVFLIESSSNHVTITVYPSADSYHGLSVERWSATHGEEGLCAGDRASS